jgi:hypothetical protein
MDAHAVFHAVKPVFESLKDRPYLEVEVRLGRHNGKFFDTNLGKETFDRIVDALKRYDGWEETASEDTEVFIKGDIRMVLNEEQDSQEVHRKVKINKIDLNLKDRPLDARVAFAQEIPAPDFDTDTEMDSVRVRHRDMFLRKNLRIDCTTVQGGEVDPDAEDDTVFQVEMEIVDPTKVNDDNDLFNILYKLQDILDTIK